MNTCVSIPRMKSRVFCLRKEQFILFTHWYQGVMSNFLFIEEFTEVLNNTNINRLQKKHIFGEVMVYTKNHYLPAVILPIEPKLSVNENEKFHNPFISYRSGCCHIFYSCSRLICSKNPLIDYYGRVSCFTGSNSPF